MSFLDSLKKLARRVPLAQDVRRHQLEHRANSQIKDEFHRFRPVRRQRDSMPGKHQGEIDQLSNIAFVFCDEDTCHVLSFYGLLATTGNRFVRHRPIGTMNG